MSKLNFFQSIFCKGDVNIYISAEEEEEINDDFEFSLKLEEKSSEILHTEDTPLITNALIEEDVKDGLSFDLNNNLNDNQVFKTDFVSDTIKSDIDLHKEPIVSGFIFDDIDDNDAEGFNMDIKVTSDKSIEEIDDNALNLIERLKSDGIEKEREKEAIKNKNQEIYEKVAKVDSEIDMPLL